jgi:hypothetical protein
LHFGYDGGGVDDLDISRENLSLEQPLGGEFDILRDLEGFGWTIGGLKDKYRGLERVGWSFTMAAAAYNLIRLPKLRKTGIAMQLSNRTAQDASTIGQHQTPIWAGALI